MNEIKVFFSPELNIDLTEFVEAWNNNPKCIKIAKAQLNQLPNMHFANQASTNVAVILSIVGTITANIVSSALYDFITSKEQPEQTFQCKVVELEDGDSIIKVLPNKNDMPPSE